MIPKLILKTTNILKSKKRRNETSSDLFVKKRLQLLKCQAGRNKDIQNRAKRQTSAWTEIQCIVKGGILSQQKKDEIFDKCH